MASGPLVTADHVWKRYSRTMRRSVNHALADGFRAFLGVEQTADELRDDEFWSLRDVSFAVGPGEAMAVVGTNGAGKSTLLKILSGVIGPDRGELRVRGRIVSMMIAGVGFHPVLTGRENVFIYGSILGLRRRDLRRKIPEILEFADLREFFDTPVKYYSTGMYTRLAFAVAAHTNPDVFVIDEVLAVGDVAFRAKCIDRLQSMKRDGCALLIVSHSAGQVRAIADHGIWLHRGQCLASGPIEQVLDRYLESETVAKEGAPAPGGELVANVGEPAAVVAANSSVAPPSEPDVRLEVVRVDHDAPLVLRAHEANRVTLRLRARERLVEPNLTIAFETDGKVTAAATLALGGATFPVLGGDRAILVSLDVTPRLSAVTGDVTLRLRANDADGTVVVRAEARCPSRIDGASATPDAIDLQETIAIGEPADAGPAAALLVAAGATVPIAVPRVPDATAWSLHDPMQRVIVRRPIPAATTESTAVVGTFRAHLPPGTYRQALEVGGAPVYGSWVQVTETAEPVGHVDLDATCHVEPSSDGGGAPRDGALRIVGLHLEGSSHDLDTMLGGAPRFVTDARQSTPRTTALVTGETCRLRLSLQAGAPFTDWDVTIGFGHAERGRCAGMRTQRATLLPAEGAFDVCFRFTTHLARGDYLVGCTVTARDADGRRVEASVPASTRCFVLGPRETNSDGDLEIRDLSESAVAAVGEPERTAEAADLDDTGLRLSQFTIDGHGGDDRVVARHGEPLTADLVVSGATAVDQPSFKFAFVAPTGRCVARMTDFESRHPLGPVPASTPRRWTMRFVPHLAGGRYQVQVAVLQRRGRDFVVTDRRHQGVTCLVPATARAVGPGLLEVTATIDSA